VISIINSTLLTLRLLCLLNKKQRCWESWDTAFIPSALIDSMTIVNDTEGDSEERQGYDPAQMGVDDDSEGDSKHFQDFLIVDSDDEDDMEIMEAVSKRSENERYMLSKRDIQLCGSRSVIARVDGVDRDEQHLLVDIIGAGLVEDERGVKEPYIRYVCSTSPLNSYTDAEYFLGAFPTLFWTGKGGHLEERRPKVSFQMWVRYLLNHHSRRFVQHPWFMFLAFNIYIRREASSQSHLIVSKKSWPKI